MYPKTPFLFLYTWMCTECNGVSPEMERGREWEREREREIEVQRVKKCLKDV